MRRPTEECTYCVGYAQWDPQLGLGVYPGLECRGGDNCPLWRKYGKRYLVTQRDTEELAAEAKKIDRRLESLNARRETE